MSLKESLCRGNLDRLTLIAIDYYLSSLVEINIKIEIHSQYTIRYQPISILPQSQKNKYFFVTNPILIRKHN